MFSSSPHLSKICAENSVDDHLVELPAAENSVGKNGVEFSASENSVDIIFFELSAAENSGDNKCAEFSAAENSKMCGKLDAGNSRFTCLCTGLSRPITLRASDS